MDFENDYKTLDVDYMESVIWAFKQLHDKGLAYKGYRVLPYCWQDETPLSNHELRMDDDVYKMRQDQTVTVTFPLTAGEAELSGSSPACRRSPGRPRRGRCPPTWRSPSGPTSTTSVLPAGPQRRQGCLRGRRPVTGSYLLAADLLRRLRQGPRLRRRRRGVAAAEAAVTSTHTGAELEGVAYEPLWDYYADTEK